ncbi:MAG: sulfatase-like hydrolase/transferase [Phycisphaerales bacterium]|nr:sulfatase-like hydrolase/transferase [Phycisphaerales bacterium]
MPKLRKIVRLARRAMHKGELARLWANRQARQVDPEQALATVEQRGIHPESVLFITIDSCRYDTFVRAECPNLKSIGPLIEAEAPATFTLPSHTAMFVGITPRVGQSREPLLNPTIGRIFRLQNRIAPGRPDDYMQLEGKNIIEGFNRLGYVTVGTGAMRWFDPQVPTCFMLTSEFQKFRYTATDVEAQVKFLLTQMAAHPKRPLFLFMNIGETHTPYRHRGAPWPTNNPCVSNKLEHNNNAQECRDRQTWCLEFVDKQIEPLIKAFQKAGASIVACADHGDCHGEDGLWGHCLYHDKVMKVPMVMHLRPREKKEPPMVEVVRQKTDPQVPA